uniref:Uncharacterized protein n=1 Tax=Anguilla anguilla TaxID=7936 RepID=A0A0E9QN38_ANGAN
MATFEKMQKRVCSV